MSPFIEEQIVKRDDNSWLIDGVTPIEDVRRALSIDSFPNEENYQTIAGLMMYLLKRFPKYRFYLSMRVINLKWLILIIIASTNY